MSHTAEISCDACRDNLGELLRFVETASRDAALSADIAHDVRLAAEEACVNVIFYAYSDRTPGHINLSFASDDDRVVITVRDDGRAFDPSSVTAAHTNLPVEQRTIGGLGWHLIKQVMDEVRHEYQPDRGNQLTLVKHLRHNDDVQGAVNGNIG